MLNFNLSGTKSIGGCVTFHFSPLEACAAEVTLLKLGAFQKILKSKSSVVGNSTSKKKTLTCAQYIFLFFLLLQGHTSKTVLSTSHKMHQVYLIDYIRVPVNTYIALRGE